MKVALANISVKCDADHTKSLMFWRSRWRRRGAGVPHQARACSLVKVFRPRGGGIGGFTFCCHFLQYFDHEEKCWIRVSLFSAVMLRACYRGAASLCHCRGSGRSHRCAARAAGGIAAFGARRFPGSRPTGRPPGLPSRVRRGRGARTGPPGPRGQRIGRIRPRRARRRAGRVAPAPDGPVGRTRLRTGRTRLSTGPLRRIRPTPNLAGAEETTSGGQR